MSLNSERPVKNRARWFRHRIIWGMVGILILVLALNSQLQALVWLNIAQVRRISEDVPQAQAAFEQALARDPDNRHLRWQTAATFAEAGSAEAALKAALPLAHQRPLEPYIAQLLLSMFFATDQAEQALKLYLELAPKPPVPVGIAARLAHHYLATRGALSPELNQTLLPQIFAVNMALPETQGYAQAWQQPDFWTTQFGETTRAALAWRSEPMACPTSSPSVAQTDEQHVAELLGVDPVTVALGNELAVNGMFGQYTLLVDAPSAWQAVYEVGSFWDLGAFVVGRDCSQASNAAAVRIDGLRTEQLVGRPPSNAGLSHPPIELAPDTAYAISFMYRTSNTDAAIAALWLSFDERIIGAGDRFLPATNDTWRRVTIVGWNRSGTRVAVRPLFRSWGQGSVWFDDFSFRPLTLGDQNRLQPQVELMRIVSLIQ